MCKDMNKQFSIFLHPIGYFCHQKFIIFHMFKHLCNKKNRFSQYNKAGSYTYISYGNPTYWQFLTSKMEQNILIFFILNVALILGMPQNCQQEYEEIFERVCENTIKVKAFFSIIMFSTKWILFLPIFLTTYMYLNSKR